MLLDFDISEINKARVKLIYCRVKLIYSREKIFYRKKKMS